MALCAKVVDFVRLGFLHDANQVSGVTQIAVVKLEVGVVHMWVLVDVVNPLDVEAAGAAFDALDDVAHHLGDGHIMAVAHVDVAQHRSGVLRVDSLWQVHDMHACVGLRGQLGVDATRA